MKSIYVVTTTLVCLALCGCTPVLGDCAWGGTVKAWIDANQNGVWDTGEQPLPGVTVTAKAGSISPVMTGPQGQAEIDNIWSPGCGPEGIVLVAQPPAGFRSTTRNSVSTRGDPSYSFGFTYDPNVPTATPNPVTLSCTPYTDKTSLGDLSVYDIRATPEGGIWVATGAGIAHYDPAADVWTRYPLEGSPAYSIRLGPDGAIWAGTQEGVYSKAPADKAFTQLDHLAGDYIHAVAISSGGDIWFGAKMGFTASSRPQARGIRMPARPGAWPRTGTGSG